MKRFFSGQPRCCPKMPSTTLRIFYDLETSGVGTRDFPKQHRIVEIGAVLEESTLKPEEIEVVAAAAGTAGTTRVRLSSSSSALESSASSSCPPSFFSALVNGGPSLDRVQGIHKISNADVALADPFEVVWKRLTAWVQVSIEDAEKRRGSKITRVALSGHNTQTSDNYCLLTELARCNMRIEELTGDRPGVSLCFEDMYPRKDPKKRTLARWSTGGLTNLGLYITWKTSATAAAGASAVPSCGDTTNYYGAHHCALWDALVSKENWVNSEIVRRCASRWSLEKQVAHWRLLQLKHEVDQHCSEDVED